MKIRPSLSWAEALARSWPGLPSLFLPALSLFCLGSDGFSAEPSPAAGPKLPVTEVILYSSGVGFFERSGEVDGRAEIDLRFKVDDINDLLKSMVVQDFNGGRISTVSYGSRDPLTKTLKSFGLDLTANPTMGQLLNQARGQRVEILWPNRVTGTILGVETKKQAVGEHKEIDVEYLNLVGEDGLQSIPLSQVQKVKLLNSQLDAELRQALEVLASSRDTEKKSVGLTFEGQGKRKVSVGYVTQTPVWKTSYRLVLGEKDKPFMQGWAIVENTTDEDWEDVRLSLVSGRPISFIMDLYQPLYTTRPLVQPELYLSLGPQVYGNAIEGDILREKSADAALKDKYALSKSFSVAGAAVAAAPPPASEMRVAERLEQTRGAETLARKLSLADGVTAAAQGAQAGELFQYQIQAPVRLARQKSAMLPILNERVAGDKISIYNASVQPKYPLNGFRLKNTSALHLMQGPLTVFEEGAYAGDARIEDLAPGQERLLSYGLDLKTEVEPQAGSGRTDLVTVKIRKGTLITTRKASESKTYNVRNRDQKKKTILIEHPFRTDWELIDPKEKPERTREVYRFAVTVDPDKTAKLSVQEERQYDEQVQLASFSNDALNFYLRAPKVSSKVKEALQHVAQLRNVLSATTQDRTRREQRVNEITQEQSRIRENMARLNANSELYIRYVKKLDQQETELDQSRQQIEALKETEAKQQRELNDYLMALTVE